MRHYNKSIIAIILGASIAILLQAGESDQTTRNRGAFEKRCTGCHAMDATKVGPPLRGIFGRKAASDPRFPYSEALRGANLKWDDVTLDRWLSDPDSVAPGNEMPFRLDNAADRKAIIAWLKQ